MTVGSRGEVVLLGMMTKMPVAGVVWQTVHYLEGFERLGYDAYYVEAHARTPSMLMESQHDDGSAKAAGFIAKVMRRFGLADRWVYHALHADGRCYGMDASALRRLYRDAAVIINLHGGTAPRPEHYETGRLVYLETDPVQLQIELAHERPETIEFLEPHSAFFTFAENYGQLDCLLPSSHRFKFRPTRQPVVLQLWQAEDLGQSGFTTIGSWRQPWRDVCYNGERYGWSKRDELLKILDLPRRVDHALELALAGCPDEERQLLERHGWVVRDALRLSWDIDAYQSYIRRSRGELTVAKDQNVRLRSGWFSDRSASYLAAGRPVITQDTGFGNVLPTGDGLLAFSTAEDAAAAVDTVASNYAHHVRAAAAVAREYFDADRVLGGLLDELGLPARRRDERGDRDASSDERGFPPELRLTVQSRRPTRLHPDTEEWIARRPLPRPAQRADDGAYGVTIVLVTYNNLPFTRLCVESVLLNTDLPNYQLVVVDNHSGDGTRQYLHDLQQIHPQVVTVLQDANAGFGAACNEGLRRAAGDVLVLLNNDTVVPPGWLGRLVAHLDDERIGLVGPVTNRIGNEAEIRVPYDTYGGLVEFSSKRSVEHPGKVLDLPTATMFCVAMRRSTFDELGPLDERFEVGLLEDDDYSTRARAAGYRVVCADDAFVHHFGEATFGTLVPTGEYAAILQANRQRYQDKWGVAPPAYGRRSDPEYADLIGRFRRVVSTAVPDDAVVMVVSRGDDELLKLGGRRAWHFPQDQDGVYAGHYPADSAEAIAHLEALRRRGGVYLLFPRTAYWWLEHYPGFAEHLDRRYRRVETARDTCAGFDLSTVGTP